MGVCDLATKRCWRTYAAQHAFQELQDIKNMFLSKDSLNDFV